MVIRMNAKSGFWYPVILTITAVLSYGYNVTHFAIGVDDTTLRLTREEGLEVCIHRCTLFILNRVLHLNIISWPTWLVEGLSVCILAVSFSLWIFLINRSLVSVGILLPKWFYGLAAALALSCPVISEIWVYYMHCGIAIGYGLTALALFLFLQSLRHACQYRWIKILGSGLCLAVALSCYETMMDCYLIGACIIFMILRALSEEKENRVYDIRPLPWMLTGGIVLAVSLTVRTLMYKILMEIYHLDQMAKYGMSGYNPLFGELFVAPGALGMLLKKMYLRYFVNGVVYLPITFLVLSWIVAGSFALFYTIRKRDLWIALCMSAILFVPVLSSIAAGRAEPYHSAQFIPVVIMSAFLLVGIVSFYGKGLKKNVLILGGAIAAVIGIILQIRDMNKWFRQDYDKYLEAKQIMTDAAENLINHYDIRKPIVVVGATVHRDELYREAAVSMDSWQYRVISKLTSFDPTIKEKFHGNYGGWVYLYAESPTLSVLTWARNPYENCDLAAAQQYTNFWEMIGYSGFTYAPTTQMIERAEEIRDSLGMPGYPDEGYIVDYEDMLIVNLSEVE